MKVWLQIHILYIYVFICTYIYWGDDGGGELAAVCVVALGDPVLHGVEVAEVGVALHPAQLQVAGLVAPRLVELQMGRGAAGTDLWENENAA